MAVVNGLDGTFPFHGQRLPSGLLLGLQSHHFFRVHSGKFPAPGVRLLLQTRDVLRVAFFNLFEYGAMAQLMRQHGMRPLFIDLLGPAAARLQDLLLGLLPLLD